MFTKRVRLLTILALMAGVLLPGLLLTSSAAGAEAQGKGGPGEQGGLFSSPAPLLPGAAAEARVIAYSYDAAGRLTQADYDGGTGVAYRYDAAGNLVSVWPGGRYSIHLPLVLRR